MEAKVSPEAVKAKAELLAGGAVKIAKGFRLPFSPSKSTAGPGAGLPEIVISFGDTRAKKVVSRTEGEFELIEDGESLTIVRGSDVVVDDVYLQPTLHHAPFQAFINIDSSCIFNCVFCNAHRLEHYATKNLTDDKIVNMAVLAASSDGFAGIALTSGVPQTQDDVTERMSNIVRKIRAALPDTPIGVEPYVTHPRQIDDLKAAGATEIKLNIETFDPDIFEKACPGRDYSGTLHAINHACRVFGRNRVCSNIIFGLGETDDCVVQGARVLANMGAVATLRALRLNKANASEIMASIGSLQPVTADRMLALARKHKVVLKDHDLTPLTFKTMCHACLSCDIVPFWDL
ncbi:MAG: radical SAM protein [Methanobacteriota archaeon]|nr:MAG: radical SAM protein [Euryarchaeota archaeon]